MSLKTILIAFLFIFEGIFFYVTLLYFNLSQTDCWGNGLGKWMEKWMLNKFPNYISVNDAKNFCDYLKENIAFWYYNPLTGQLFYIYKNGTQTANPLPFTSTTSTTTTIK